MRCIRIHTNIDLTKVRFNSVRYNIWDLESKSYVPERSCLIVDTWLRYIQNKRTVVFCACDLLNEGWDCPEIEVLFMARPTMSRVLYTQQLGRGMRLYEGKESLMVFDFVDNASQYNMPMSLHRLFKLRKYRAGELVLSPWDKRAAENALYDRWEIGRAHV